LGVGDAAGVRCCGGRSCSDRWGVGGEPEYGAGIGGAWGIDVGVGVFVEVEVGRVALALGGSWAGVRCGNGFGVDVPSMGDCAGGVLGALSSGVAVGVSVGVFCGRAVPVGFMPSAPVRPDP
jgi:hypothetical protein